MKTKTQNGKRFDKPTTEGRTCTVQALANVSGISYTEAHAILKEQGREDGHGFSPLLSQMRKSFAGRFLIHDILAWGSVGYGMTLAQFAKRNWTGSFYVIIQKGDASRGTFKAHAVAVVNGVVIDNLPKSWLRARVTKVWEFEQLRQFQQAC